MSFLLQRLARQALGTGGPRIRSAATMRALVPLAAPVREQIGAPDDAPALANALGPTATVPTPTVHDAPSRRGEVLADTITERRVIHEVAAQPGAPAINADAGLDRQMAVAGPPPAFDETRSAPRVPTPLLPDAIVAAPVPVIISNRPGPPQEIRTHASGEPTEVHVHIGRIEVTALQAPAPSKRRERPARPSLPLSDYLKRRSS